MAVRTGSVCRIPPLSATDLLGTLRSPALPSPLYKADNDSCATQPPRAGMGIQQVEDEKALSKLGAVSEDASSIGLRSANR